VSATLGFGYDLEPLSLEKQSGAILPIQAHQDAIASHLCFAAEGSVKMPIQTKSIICFMLTALLVGCVEMVVPGQLDG
jgi:hypothetical protein